MDENLSTFQVYNASAGSGKTFTLVKEYLKIILQSDDVFTFQKVLAVTFTNKAAGEMKERLLGNLEAYSEGKETDMFSVIVEETNLNKTIIVARSKKILDAILRNYTAFSITTIDSFTHKIIKSFAYDLGLPLNFEVELDATELLAEAIDVLISKIGTDKELTKVLIDYSLEKTDDDKSWDISLDLNNFSKVLLSENDAKHFKTLANKTLSDFYELKNKVRKSLVNAENQFKEIGNKALHIIENSGLEYKNFSRSTVPNFFSDIAYKGTSIDYVKRSATITKTIDEHKFYTKTASAEIISSIEGIIPELVACFEQTKQIYGELVLHQLVLKSIIPLAVLNNINSELNHLKEDNNIRLNAEFNQLISENIKNQPAPFIYERIGQRFMYYFIDEMQDTSELQWQNLIPLIDNALAQENSNLMLVGDGKQAIYRWRGGKAEQFINLGTLDEKDGVNPFHVLKEVKNLDRNWRSCSEIIDFTNQFFQYSTNFINKESYKDLYIEGNKQLENDKKGGCVTINFIAKKGDKEEQQNRYPIAVLQKIKELESKGFSRDDICVLVRGNKEGVAIANYLTNNSDIQIVSSETLLLSNSPKVNFIADVIQVILHPKDKQSIFDFLYFLHQYLNLSEDKHTFLSKFINLEISEIFKKLTEYGTDFNLSEFHQKPLYEKSEEIVRGFKLLDTSDAYVQFFLDIILEQQQKGTDLQGFLDFWSQKKERLSIAVSDTSNKVQVMTIHKSKGLEFPVVVFPCDLNIYRQIEPKTWLNDLPETYNGFKELYVNYNKNFEFIGKRGMEIHKQTREELELDNFNLLYVALTRPVEQLHIITRDEDVKDSYSTIFKSYLDYKKVWKKGKVNYIFGLDEKLETTKKESDLITEDLERFISSPLKEHHIELLPSSSRYWDTNQGKAIAYGNKVHEILSKIHFADEVDGVLNQYAKQGIINSEEIKQVGGVINKVIHHPELESFYKDEEYAIYNEREIIETNDIYIPDRLVVKGDKIIVIDYKTGVISSKHKKQLSVYANLLRKQNYVVGGGFLVYLKDELEVLSVF